MLRKSLIRIISAATILLNGATAFGAPGMLLNLPSERSDKFAQLRFVAGTYGPCLWTRWRGWHQNGRWATSRSCQPGSEWRYERRCWIGPNNVRHCRYYG